MSNLFEHADKIAATAAALVGGDLGVAGMIYSDLSAEYTEGAGKTVSIRVPGATQSNTKDPADVTTPLVSSDITENTIPVTLTDHIYSLSTLSEQDLSLDIKDFAAQVLAPQSRSIVAHIERSAITALQSTPEDTAIAYDSANPAAMFTQFRKTLRDNGVQDGTPMYSVVGTQVYADLLDNDAMDDAGKVRGIEVRESNRLLPTEAVAFVKAAFALVVRAPKVPNGAQAGASVVAENFALRHIFTFDASVAADRSMVSTFLGVAPLPLAVVDEDAGTVTLTANAGAVRVDTATAPV